MTLTARPNGGFSFLGWGGSCGGTGTTCTLTMNGDKNVSARFGARPRLTVQVDASDGSVTGPGGINCPGTCTATYNPGQRITLTEHTTDTFLGWGGACSGTAPTCTLTMNGDKTVSADFGIADPCPPVCLRHGGASAAAQPTGGTLPQMSGALQAAAIARRQAVVSGRRASSRR